MIPAGEDNVFFYTIPLLGLVETPIERFSHFANAVYLGEVKEDGICFLPFFQTQDDLDEFVLHSPHLPEVKQFDILTDDDLVGLCQMKKLEGCTHVAIDLRPQSTYRRYIEVDKFIADARKPRHDFGD